MDNTAYYEKFNWEEANLSSKLTDKIKRIISAIPGDVKSILDVGCGDGIISKALSDKFFVTATDRSFNAVKLVRINKFQSSADNLPAKNNSFDLVFSSEMIEHLPQTIFDSAINEFKRVSKKYIFLTFPNDENIEKNLVECTRCKNIFNKSYHLRSLNRNTIEKLFGEYRVVKNFVTGHPIRGYNKLLGRIKHRLSPASSWIPKYWTPDGRRNTMCPACGYPFEIPYRFNPIATVCDLTNILLSPKKPYQLCILLKKK